MRASIRQVAARAGVSRTTVSNLLRGLNDRALPETRERVLRAAKELNYIPVPQPVTQTRRTQTKIIGLVFGDIQIYDQWGSPVYRGFCDVASERGYDLLTLLRTGPEWRIDQQQLRFLDRRSDGFIFVVPGHHYTAMETLGQHHIPVVTCSINEMVPGIPGVGADDSSFMQMAVDYLVEHGHRRIAHCYGPTEYSFFRYRCLGYNAAMASHELDSHLIGMGDDDWQEQLLRTIRQHGVTALAVASDRYALDAWQFLESQGVRIPEDISIIGVDDVPEAMHRGLTTYRCSAEMIGRAAMKMLLDLIEGDRYPNDRVTMPIELVERTSVAAPGSSPNNIAKGVE